MQTETFRLKLAKKHPRDFFRILDITVYGYQYLPYELSEAHFKELESVGAKHWIKCEERDEEEVDTNGEGFEDEGEEAPTELTDEEKKVLEDAFDLKANSENQNVDPAPVEPSEELPKNDEPTEELPKNDEPTEDQKEYAALSSSEHLNKKEKARLAELKVILKIEE